MPVLDDNAASQSQKDLDAEAHRRARGDYVDDDEGDNKDDDDAATTTTVGDDADDDKKKKKAKGDDADLDPDALKAVASDEDRPIPRSRLNEVNDKLQAERDARIRAEGERDALRLMAKGKTEVPVEKGPKIDPDDLYAQANEAMLEGDTKKAASLQKQARTIEREADLKQATEDALKTFRTEAATADFNKAIAGVIETYPFLDSKSADADSAAIAEVVEWRDMYMSKGESAADALRKAAKRIGEPIRKAAEKAKDDDDGDADDKAKGGDKGKARESQAIARGAAASLAQPARASGGRGDRAMATKNTGDQAVANMTDEEFRNLPKAEKARLRGDAVSE